MSAIGVKRTWRLHCEMSPATSPQSPPSSRISAVPALDVKRLLCGADELYEGQSQHSHPPPQSQEDSNVPNRLLLEVCRRCHLHEVAASPIRWHRSFCRPEVRNSCPQASFRGAGSDDNAQSQPERNSTGESLEQIRPDYGTGKTRYENRQPPWPKTNSQPQHFPSQFEILF